MTIEKLLNTNDLLPQVSLFLNKTDCMRLSISGSKFKDLDIEKALRSEKVHIDSFLRLDPDLLLGLIKKIRRYSTQHTDFAEAGESTSAVKELVIQSDPDDPVNDVDLANLAIHGIIHAGLQKITLKGCDSITNLGSLENCRELTELEFFNCPSIIDDVFRTLPSLPKLTHFNLSMVPNITDLSPLVNCAALTEIALMACPRITNFGPLANCVELNKVTIYHSNGDIDLSSFAGCSKLTHLSLQNCRNLTDQDLSTLPVLPSLRCLDLLGCHRIRDFRPLTSQPNLDELTAPDFMPVDLASLSNSRQSRF